MSQRGRRADRRGNGKEEGEGTAWKADDRKSGVSGLAGLACWSGIKERIRGQTVRVETDGQLAEVEGRGKSEKKRLGGGRDGIGGGGGGRRDSDGER